MEGHLQVVVKTKDGSPVSFEGLTVVACEHPEEMTTTPAPEEPEEPVDCIYKVTKKDLAQEEPVKPFDGVKAELTPEGKLEFIFEEPTPRDVSQIILKSPKKNQPFQVVGFDADGNPSEPQ